MSRCIKCNAVLSFNDIGAYKKFINRGSTEFMCMQCLCEELQISPQKMLEKIEHFKRMGCTLFV